MIDLAKYIGKRVVLQFRSPDAWLMVIQKSGKAEVAITKGPEGQPTAIPLPFLMGEIAEGGVLVYTDQNGERLEVAVNTDAVLTVTVALEPSRVKIIGG
jgi:hypothetical protein